MLFRGRNPDATVWRRFRSGVDGFTFTRRAIIYEAYVGANAERVVDLFYTLSEQLRSGHRCRTSPTCDRETTWTGESIALPDVRDAVARLKVPLATYGGVEFALYNARRSADAHAAARAVHLLAIGSLALPASGKGLEEKAASRTGRGARRRGIARRRRHFRRPSQLRPSASR